MEFRQSELNNKDNILSTTSETENYKEYFPLRTLTPLTHYIKAM